MRHYLGGLCPSNSVNSLAAKPMTQVLHVRLYSLMLACRACGIEPLAYLRQVPTELPQRAENADITDLLPFNFARTAAA